MGVSAKSLVIELDCPAAFPLFWMFLLDYSMENNGKFILPLLQSRLERK